MGFVRTVKVKKIAEGITINCITRGSKYDIEVVKQLDGNKEEVLDSLYDCKNKDKANNKYLEFYSKYYNGGL